MLLLSHTSPWTKHTSTSMCLVCRHHNGKALEKSPFVTIHSDGVNDCFPSENELVSTGLYAAKVFGVGPGTLPSNLFDQCTVVLQNLNFNGVPQQPGAHHGFESVKNAVFVVRDVAGLVTGKPQKETLGHQLLHQHGFHSCGDVRKLVVLGVGDPEQWYAFTKRAVDSFSLDPSTRFVALLFFHDLGYLRDFLAWARSIEGRVSQRALVNRQFLDVVTWSSDGKRLPDECFFV